MEVTITVLDINDNTPQFPLASLPYATSISEASSVGTQVITVQASDRDAGTNAIITFAIASGNDEGRFAIGAATGVITTAKELDFENATQYLLVVSATDGGTPTPRQATTTVTVTILDANDNTPVFNASLLHCSSVRNLSAGQAVVRVFATDADSGLNGNIRFSIKSGDALGQFQIDAVTGVITTTAALNREAIASYSLSIAARDQGSVPREAVATVRVTVLDANDNSPLFSEAEYRVTIPFSSSSGLAVVQVIASDVDEGVNREISFSIVDGNPSAAFAINSTTGHITTTQGLCLLGRSHTLIVKAEDKGTPALSSTALVKVSTSTVNDFTPIFAQSVYNATTLFENTAPGFLLQRVSATDADCGDTDRLVFAVTGGDSLPPKFSVNASSGEIRTTSVPVDFETTSLFILTIQVTDGSRTSTATVRIPVVDQNDLAPVFSRTTYSFNVSEAAVAGAVIGKISASDLDVSNTALDFSIISGNTGGAFAVDISTGDISVNATLDRELVASYTLTLQVQDSGFMTATSIVQITVLDVNDNRPVFDRAAYEVSISEIFPRGTGIMSVKATDADAASNGVVRYSIQDVSGAGVSLPFAIDAVSGQVSLTALVDREVKDFYMTIVTAADLGVPSRNSSVVLNITILDENDNKPVFAQDTISMNLARTHAVGAVVVTVSATDADSLQNANITYALAVQNPAGFFAVDATTGAITLTASLFGMTGNKTTLLVTASDAGTPRLSSSATVTIHVSEVNLYAPAFAQSGYADSVSESARIGTGMILIKATDGDTSSNGVVRYSIQDASGNGSLPFAIDAVSGQVSLTALVDREVKDFYMTIVTAADQGSPSLTTSVVLNITILDVNDNTPVFYESDIALNVSRNLAVGSNITSLFATDADIQANGRVTYSVVAQSPVGFFSLQNATGLVTLSNSLFNTALSKATLVISASDGGVPPLSSTATVTISIFEVNLNTPTFAQSGYTDSVSESARIGTGMILMRAVDGDLASNGEIRYSIQDVSGAGVSLPFAIDAVSGQVSLTALVDREVKDFYMTIVTAADLGVPSRNSSVVLNITILDENDNKPVFAQDTISMNLARTHAVGAVVVTVSATDADSLQNANITYALAVQNPAGFFAVDATTGAITLTASLFGMTGNKTTLLVTASDAGTPRLSSSATVTIHVSEVNLYAPAFAQSGYADSVSESARIGTGMILIKATDGDTSSNGVVRYSIQDASGNGSLPFAIDAVSGQVSLTALVDREVKDFYMTIVTAADQGSPSLTTSVQLNITILDVNDNTPVFYESDIALNVSRNLAVGSNITSLFATDADIQANGRVTYSVVAQSPVGFFFLA